MTTRKFQQGGLAKTFGRNSNGAIKYIVLHETANLAPTANAQAHANLQRNNSRDASWHYQVDATQIIQSYTHDVACWHAGKGNRNSLAIELCVNGGFNQTAFTNLLTLVSELRKLYPSAKVVQHNYFTGKDCPRFIRAKGLWPQVVAASPAPKRSHIGVAKVKVDSLNLRDKPTLSGSKVVQTLAQNSTWKIYEINSDGFVKIGAHWASNKGNKYLDIQLVWD